MKYIKTYENSSDIVKNRKDFIDFTRNIIKLLNDDKLTFALSGDGYTINIYIKSMDDYFTELISEIKILTNDKIKFEIFNPKYNINKLLMNYFKNNFNMIFSEKYMCTFYYNNNLNIEEFKILIDTNKYNL